MLKKNNLQVDPDLPIGGSTFAGLDVSPQPTAGVFKTSSRKSCKVTKAPIVLLSRVATYQSADYVWIVLIYRQEWQRRADAHNEVSKWIPDEPPDEPH